jgi:hypothetical protein
MSSGADFRNNGMANFLEKSGPDLVKSAPISGSSGRVFLISGPDFETRWPIFGCLFIEKCVSELRVHVFGDLKAQKHIGSDREHNWERFFKKSS